jgi:hypothetical protein
MNSSRSDSQSLAPPNCVDTPCRSAEPCVHIESIEMHILILARLTGRIRVCARYGFLRPVRSRRLLLEDI